MNNKKTVFLIDGTLYLYKSYYKYNNIYNDLSNVVCGMNHLIKKIISIYNPIYLSIIFDSVKKNFRKIIFNKYKKNRISCPKNLILQIPKVNKIIKNMGIKNISIPSVESDDTIGTLSKQCERNGFNVMIASTDKDMIQLVSKKIKIFNIFNKIIIGPKEVYLKYNISYKYIIDYFSLIGDYSDNIPGIKGIGPKTAKILIKKYKNIKNIFNNINNIHNLKIKNLKNIIKNLIDNKNNLFLFKKLITIKTDIFTGYTIKDLKINKNNN